MYRNASLTSAVTGVFTIVISGTPAGPYTFDAADMDEVIRYADLVAAEGYSLDPDFYNPFTANESPEKILTDLLNFLYLIVILL